MNQQNDKDEVRDLVARTYTEALRRAQAGGGGCCGGAPSPAGAAAQLAGYDADLAAVPAGAARSSFGCGNPVAFAAVRPGQTVVDLGAGAGLDLILAARKVGPGGRVIGVDMTDAMLEAARANVAAAGLTNVEVRKGWIEALPLEDASADWVISNCVINLSPDKPAVFREIARVLRPGGRFSISDLVAEDLPAELRADRAIYSSCIGGAIAAADYVAGLQRAGLRDVEVRDRVVYDATTLQGIADSELDRLGADAATAAAKIAKLAGRVQSVRFVGRAPS